MVGIQDELRRYPRLPGEHRAQVRRVNPQGLEAFLKTSDVGPGGCALISGGHIGIGASLEMVLNLGGRFVEAEGRVVYERRRLDGTFEVGVAFTSLTPPGPQVIDSMVLQRAAGHGHGHGAKASP